jgi:uncharacterized membrane protein
MKRRLVRGSVAVLVVIGVVSAAGRALFIPDLLTRVEPGRIAILSMFHDPAIAHTEAELHAFDHRYGDHPSVTLLHVIPGGLFLALAPLQFWAVLRRRNPALHRWSGRVLLALAAIALASAFHLAFVVPFGGLAETVTIGFFGALFVYSLSRAYTAIRRRDIAVHREWMIRGFAIALAISTVRIVGGAFDAVLMPPAADAAYLFVVSLWIGWLATIAAAELWIRHTRPSHGFHPYAPETARRHRLGQPLTRLRRSG